MAAADLLAGPAAGSPEHRVGVIEPGGTSRCSPLWSTLAVAVWVPIVLVADMHANYLQQCGLGALTWLLLFALLRREDGLTRAQVAVVVVYATAIEFTFSGLLHVYEYRLHESAFLARVPQFVPPGHGLVYLGAVCFGRSAWVRAHARLLVRATLVAGTAYALWGLFLATRLDVLGALWFGCLVWFLVRGRQPLVYVGAFLLVTWLEWLGTGLGTWAWAHHSPTGIIPMGNPPADAAGGYGFFDAAALLLGPAVIQAYEKVRGSALLRVPGRGGPDDVVEVGIAG